MTPFEVAHCPQSRQQGVKPVPLTRPPNPPSRDPRHRRAALRGGVQSTAVSAESRAAKDVVLKYYRCWNARDVDQIMAVIADDCHFEDLVFQEPFVGREAIGKYFDEIREFLDPEVQFVVDDVTAEDAEDGQPGKVGILWHAEVDGIEFPFSRGASFYRVNEEGKISFVRDVVEPALKPGHAALGILTFVTPIVKKLGQRASPQRLKELPIASGLWWFFYADYIFDLFISRMPPGVPVLETPPSTFETIFHESINFFYVDIFLNFVGLTLIPSVAEHPVSEGIFNFVGAWSMMWLPLMLSDLKGQNLGKGAKWGLWTGTMLLTNVFFIPYMALRAAPSKESTVSQRSLPEFSPFVGGLGALMGVVSLAWLFVGRGEFGGISDRVNYFVHQFTSDRAFFAFCVDTGLYTVFQAVLMPDAPAKYRFFPFFGLAAFLMDPKSRLQES